MIEVLVVSDFNIDLFGRYLEVDQSTPTCRAKKIPYGLQALIAPPRVGSDGIGFAWTRPEGVIPEFARIEEGEVVDVHRIMAAVGDFGDQLKRFASEVRVLFVASWVRSFNGRGLGMLDWTTEGHAYLLAKMNLCLAQAFSNTNNVFMLDCSRWLDAGQPGARDSKYWFAMKSPFTEAVFQSAARDVKAAIRGSLGQTRKVIAVDLDDTLWGGLVGEEGWENLNLGGHDHVGEAFVEFQRSLKALTRRGVQVVLVSKNDEATAMAAFDNHPAMVLRRQDIAGPRNRL